MSTELDRLRSEIRSLKDKVSELEVELNYTRSLLVSEEEQPADLKVHLTGKEKQLLRVFMASPGRVLSKATILERMYLMKQDQPSDKIVDVFVCKLRRCLRGSRYSIVTAWGQGYKLVINDAPVEPHKGEEE